MKVLIIDRDTMFSNLLAAKIRAAGHEVVEAPVKADGIEQIGAKSIDIVYMDPAPLADPKSIILQIRRQVHSYPYLILMGEGADGPTAVRAGCHDALAKPLNPEQVTTTLANGERLGGLIQRISDESFDFPSAGGVISKSAFNQLFLSALDRVGRYGEDSHVLFIGIANYEDLKLDDGKYAADFAVSKLAQVLARIRRQSDILAQTGTAEFALLLQRPQTPTESLDAAKRFSSTLDLQTDLSASGMNDLGVEVSLVRLPSGNLEFHRLSRIKATIGLEASA